MTFSIIIPAYNERSHIGACVRSVRLAARNAQIIVADGNSTDGTPEIAKREGALVVDAVTRRGVQCNCGATQATGEILLFLHADTTLPPDAFRHLTRAFDNPHVDIGTFRLAFDDQHLLLRFYSWWTRFDSLFTRFGDQCFVVRKTFFETLGGFPPWPLFEDVELLRRARKITTIHSFPAEVISSARRFQQNGYAAQQIRNGWYILQYLAGVSPECLAAKYNGDRKNRVMDEPKKPGAALQPVSHPDPSV